MPPPTSTTTARWSPCASSTWVPDGLTGDACMTVSWRRRPRPAFIPIGRCRASGRAGRSGGEACGDVNQELGSLVIVLVAAALAPLIVDLPRRVQVPAVVAEITLGILVGPQVLGFAKPEGVVEFLSEVGLAFLFFVGGMEIDFVRIRGAPARLAGAGWAMTIAIALGARWRSRRSASSSRPCSSGSRSRRPRSGR